MLPDFGVNHTFLFYQENQMHIVKIISFILDHTLNIFLSDYLFKLIAFIALHCNYYKKEMTKNHYAVISVYYNMNVNLRFYICYNKGGNKIISPLQNVLLIYYEMMVHIKFLSKSEVAICQDKKRIKKERRKMIQKCVSKEKRERDRRRMHHAQKKKRPSKVTSHGITCSSTAQFIITTINSFLAEFSISSRDTTIDAS